MPSTVLCTSYFNKTLKTSSNQKVNIFLSLRYSMTNFNNSKSCHALFNSGKRNNIISPSVYSYNVRILGEPSIKHTLAFEQQVGRYRTRTWCFHAKLSTRNKVNKPLVHLLIVFNNFLYFMQLLISNQF